MTSTDKSVTPSASTRWGQSVSAESVYSVGWVRVGDAAYMLSGRQTQKKRISSGGEGNASDGTRAFLRPRDDR